MSLRSGLLLTMVLCGCVFAQLSAVAANFPSAKVFEGKLDADGLPTSGARLCVEPELRNCFQMPASSPKGEAPGFYQFGLEPKMKPLPLSNGDSWVLFSAMFSGGGSGTLTRYAILRQQGSGSATRLVNLLPDVALTNVSDEAVWNEPKISPYPLLITADFIWNFAAGEAHFSAHRFAVHAWRFDATKERYVRVVSYTTTKRYSGLDDTDSVKVITPERAEILQRLHSAENR